LRTSDWEIPNRLAICDRGTPALKAARTALSFPSRTRGNRHCRAVDRPWLIYSIAVARRKLRCSAIDNEAAQSSDFHGGESTLSFSRLIMMISSTVFTARRLTKNIKFQLKHLAGIMSRLID
jgi:hypothetical protein